MSLVKHNGSSATDKIMNDFFGEIEEMFSKPINSTYNHSVSGKNYNITDDAFIYSIPLAGCSDDDVDIELDGNEITISASYKDDDYSNVVDKKFSINSDKYKIDEIEASMNNGLLKITFPFKKQETSTSNKKKIM